ncbi:MAG: BON domain-containing protein [Rhodospirillaceae bacterium]
MANKWRDEDYNRYSDEEIRRFRARGYDQPRQYAQDFSSTAQYGNYGNDGETRSEREYQHRQREHLRRGVPEWDNHAQPDDYAKPGTFYYGGTPQRRFGLRPNDTTYEDDSTLDYTTHNYGSSYGSSYATDSARMDSAFRDVAAYERDMAMAHDEDHPQRTQHTRGRGMFHDDPNRGPIDRMRNWMNHRGKGPKGYARSDDRIREDVSDHLTQDYLVDASNIEVVVVDCECTLNGSVATRDEKRRAEDLVERIMGVKHVQNNLRVAPTATSALSTQDREGTMSTTMGANPTLSANRTTNNY